MGNKKRLKAYLLLLTTAACWGWAAPVVKYTLGFVSPEAFLFYRFWIVSIFFLIPFLAKIKRQPLPKKDFWALVLIGFLGGPATLWLIFTGANLTISIDSSLIVAMAPIFIVLAGGLFLKEKITLQEKAGMSLALTGTLVTILEPLLAGGLFGAKHLGGNLIVLSSNLVWAGYVILVKKYSSRYSTIVITALTFFVGAVAFTPLFLATNQGFNLPPPAAVPGILYMSIFSSIIAYTTYNWGVSLIEASEATIFTYLQPIFAAPLSYFWLKEEVSRMFFVGAAIIGLGVYLTERRTPLFHRR